MSEIVFLVEEAPEGGFTARALGHPIFTEGDTFDEIEENARDAVLCHFEDDQRPATIRAARWRGCWTRLPVTTA